MPGSDRQRPRRAVKTIWGLTIGLLLLGAAAAGVSEVVGRGPSATAVGWPLVISFGLVLTAAGYLIIRFQWRGEVNALDLFEAALAPAMFALSGALLVVVVVVAQAAAEALRRNHWKKACFNVAQWAAASGIGAVVLAGLRRDDLLSVRNVGALVLALAAVGIVNNLAVAVVIGQVEGRGLGAALAGLRPVILIGWVGSWTVNCAFGLLFVSAYLRSPAALGLFVVPLAFLHWGSRAFAVAMADQARLRGLQQASHALVEAFDPRDALGGFLEAVRACFGAERVELVLRDDPSAGVHWVDDLGYHHWPGAGGGSGLLPLIDAVEGTIRCQPPGWRNALATPLRGPGRLVVGALSVYNTGGMEGSEVGEISVIEALASEMATALVKASLLDTVFEERRKLQNIIESTSDGIFTLDPRGVVESWNPAMEDITGYRAAETVGRRLGACLPSLRDAGGRRLDLDRWAREGAALDIGPVYEVQVVRGDGATRWLSLSCSGSGEGGPPRLVVVARDVTRVHELDRLKDDFVAIVSHELRTPLTPILGFARMMLDRGEQMSLSTRQTVATSILQSAQRLERLILNLLEVSRIEQAVVDVSSAASCVDIRDVVNDVAEEFRSGWPGLGLVIDAEACPPGTLVPGPAVWVERVLSNLVSNAMKYAPSLEPIEIQVRAGEDGFAEIAVVDHGPGIPDDALERIFERFERLDLSGCQAGTGLGLYIARQLSEAMGGTLTVFSEAGEGSTFVMRLPLIEGSVGSVGAVGSVGDADGRALPVAHGL